MCNKLPVEFHICRVTLKMWQKYFFVSTKAFPNSSIKLLNLSFRGRIIFVFAYVIFILSKINNMLSYPSVQVRRLHSLLVKARITVLLIGLPTLSVFRRGNLSTVIVEPMFQHFWVGGMIVRYTQNVNERVTKLIKKQNCEQGIEILENSIRTQVKKFLCYLQ